MARVRTTMVADPPATVGDDDPPTFFHGWLAAHPATSDLLVLDARATPAPIRRDHYLLADGRTTWQQEVLNSSRGTSTSSS